MSTKQLYEKTSQGLKEFNPLVNLKNIQDSLSDTDLGTILNLYNHIKVDWRTDKAQTRRQVPIILRRSGMFITYHNGTKFVTEFYTGSNDTVQTSDWEQDSNWTAVPDADYISAGVKPGVGTIGYDQLNDNLKQLFKEKVNVTNYPDDEDICSQDNLLKLKDREADASNFQSKGYVILRKNLVTVNGVVKNILTQSMINKPNTIYEIRYDFESTSPVKFDDSAIVFLNGGSLGENISYLRYYGCIDNGFDMTETNTIAALIHDVATNKTNISLMQERINTISNSISNLSLKGNTESRPKLANADEGTEYYDSTLKKKILWNGTVWVNLDGTTLS